MRGLQLGKGALWSPPCIRGRNKKRDTLRGIGYGETVTMKKKGEPKCQQHLIGHNAPPSKAFPANAAANSLAHPPIGARAGGDPKLRDRRGSCSLGFETGLR